MLLGRHRLLTAFGRHIAAAMKTKAETLNRNHRRIEPRESEWLNADGRIIIINGIIHSFISSIGRVVAFIP